MYFYSALVFSSSGQIIYQCNFEVWYLDYGKVTICIENYIKTSKKLSKLLGCREVMKTPVR